MIFEPVKPFLAAAFQIKFATDEWEIRGAEALRREVFCEEQHIFKGSDADELDGTAIPLVALSMFGVAADSVVGTVRIHPHPTQPGVWAGSRLAVSKPYRRMGAIGANLIKLAVSSAHGRGCTEFFGNVQAQNVELFRAMHWRTVKEITLHGWPHHVMTPDLAHYPPFLTPEVGFLALPKAAA